MHFYVYIYIYICTTAISTPEVPRQVAPGFRIDPKAGGAAQSLRHPPEGLRGGMEGPRQEEGPRLRFLWLLENLVRSGAKNGGEIHKTSEKTSVKLS